MALSKEKRIVNFLKAQVQKQVPIAQEMYLPNTSNVQDWARKDRLGANILTANRLVATNAIKVLESVANLASWIAGTSNQVTVTDDGDGSITLSLPQDIATSSSPTFTGLTLSGLTDNRLLFGVSDVITGDADLTFNPTGNVLACGGYMNVGSTTQANAIGDFAAGVSGDAELWYDSSSSKLWIMSDPGTDQSPSLYIVENDATADQQIWRFVATNNTFQLLTVNDAENVDNIVMRVNRSGASPTSVIFNEDSVDCDFRVESNENANMLFVDGGADNVGIGTGAPNSTCLLELVSTTKSLGLPVMTTTQRDAISSPKEGSLIFNTTTNKLNFYTGAAWEAVTSA